MTAKEPKIDPQGINHNLPKDEYTHIIALVHGIRDIGAWQRTVSSELMVLRGVQVVQIRYGMFSAWRFLCPLPIFFGAPMKKVISGLNNLRNEYPNARLSVIAHSFGTFLTLRALKNDHLIQLWKIVFCGSVVDDLVPWVELRRRVGDGERPTREFIVNDCGTADHWPVLGTAFGWFYGMAGAVGFSEEYVTNRFHCGGDGKPGGHSLYFDPKFVAEKWRPFLIDDAPIGSGDGYQGQHLSLLTKAFYNPLAQWMARLSTLAAWLLIPICCLLFAFGLLGLLAPPVPKAPTVLRVGIKQWIGYTPLVVAQELKLFPKDIAVAFVDVKTVSDMSLRLNNNEIDLGMGLVETHVRDCEKYQERPTDENRPVAILKIDTSRGADGIVARPGINSVKDLGNVAGEQRRFLYQEHDVSHFLFRHLWGKEGLRGRDFRGFGDNASPELAAKEFADSSRSYYAAGTYDPYLTFILSPGNEFHVKDAHLLIHSDSPDMQDMVVDIMVTRQKFLNANRAAVEALLEGWFAAVDILNDKSHQDHAVAIGYALKFNGIPPDGLNWSAKSWQDNAPCREEELAEMIDGLSGRYRSPDQKLPAWPDRKENREFFRVSGSNLPSKFHQVFNKCKELREGRVINLNPRDFDGSFVVLELKNQ